MPVPFPRTMSCRVKRKKSARPSPDANRSNLCRCPGTRRCCCQLRAPEIVARQETSGTPCDKSSVASRFLGLPAAQTQNRRIARRPSDAAVPARFFIQAVRLFRRWPHCACGCADEVPEREPSWQVIEVDGMCGLPPVCS